jgi:hypothetical protein
MRKDFFLSHHQLWNMFLEKKSFLAGKIPEEPLYVNKKEVNGVNSFLKSLFGINEKNRAEFGDLESFREVSWEPRQVRPGDNVSINYQGLLKNSATQTVFLHYGFDSWNGVREIPMERTENNLFRANITAQGHSEINFCFKDNANNWDNNNGHNWNVHLH